MAFNDEVVKDGRGVVYKLDISLDNFSTITYRYSTHANVDATNAYDPRIKAIGSIGREFGVDHLLASTSFDVVLDNADGGIDWLTNIATADDMLASRMRLYIGLFDVAAPTSIVWKQLGEYLITDHPERREDVIALTVSDDMMGWLQDVVPTPTIRNWYELDANCPLRNLADDAKTAMEAEGALEVCIPLAWGSEWLMARLPSNRHTLSGAQQYATIFPLYCTTRSNQDGSEVQKVLADVTANFTTIIETADPDGRKPEFVRHSAGNHVHDLPPTIVDITDGVTELTIWSFHRSSSFDYGGKTWYVWYLAVFTRPTHQWAFMLNGSADRYSEPHISQMDMMISFPTLWVKGFPFSAQTITTQAQQTPSDIITDIITYYSPGTVANLDTTSIARVKANYPAWADACLVINGQGGARSSLAKVLSEFAESFDFDLYLTWLGTIGMSARNLDYTSQTATFFEINESRIKDMREVLPSREQRGAYYNRIYLDNFRTDLPPLGRDPVLGPFDAPGLVGAPDPPITVEQRICPKTLGSRWQTMATWQWNPWNFRNVDTKVRNRVTFETDLEALQLELGDYFKLTWTRTLGGPYATPTLFQVEELTLDPARNTVRMSGLWADDLRTDKPYLLDNETFLTRVNSSGGRTATVTNSSTTVTFSSGNLVGDGVAAGDHLILKDATNPSSMTRFRALKIASVDSATQLTISDPDLAFGGTGVAVATWEIRRSHLTYPTFVTDPVNYDSGSTMYGRCADDVVEGEYSDATAAHQLLDG